MKNPRVFFILLLLLLLFSIQPASACNSRRCCESFSKGVRAGVTALSDGIHTAGSMLAEGVKITAHTSGEVIHEVPNQISAIPDRLAEGAGTAEQASNSITERLTSAMQAVARAVISFSASLLRLVFFPFLGRV